MAIGDRCSTDQDCDSGTLADISAICVSGTCVEPFGGGNDSTATPSPSPTPTTVTRPPGLCQADGDCPQGSVCNFNGSPQYLNDDLTNPYYTCVVNNKAPTADFTFSIANNVVTFRDNSVDSDGSIASRTWRFGDGQTSTAVNPTHTYNVVVPTTYLVQLIVTDNLGAQSEIRKNISVQPPPLEKSLQINASPSTISISAPGRNAGTLLSILRTNFSGSVTVRAESPTDITTTIGTQTTTLNTVDINFTAQKSGTYSVKIIASADGVTNASTLVTLNVSELSTYKTIIVADPLIAGDVTGTADKTPQPRLLENGQKELEATTGTITNLSAQERSGYAFDGWYRDGVLLAKNKTPSISSDKNETYVAKFIPVECTSPTGDNTRTRNVTCTSINSTLYNTGTAIITENRVVDITALGPGECPFTWEVVSTNVSSCSFVPATCTPPTTGFTKTIDVACTTLGSQYISGVAKQTQVRSYDPAGPAGTTCSYTAWTNSGLPDTSNCQIANAPCTAPTGPFSQDITVPCTSINLNYTGGTATQKQIRSYDSTITGGVCPYTDWQNSGQLDTSMCTSPTYWRECVTGELKTGVPPLNYSEVIYSGPGGGTCWEPPIEIGFSPSLNEVLKFQYQRGSSTYPTAKTITVSNPSYVSSYKLTFTTNTDVKLTSNGLEGNGTISFILAPRTNKTITINVTATLLEKLQDGMSSLSMAVEYERVV